MWRSGNKHLNGASLHPLSLCIYTKFHSFDKWPSQDTKDTIVNLVWPAAELHTVFLKDIKERNVLAFLLASLFQHLHSVSTGVLLTSCQSVRLLVNPQTAAVLTERVSPETPDSPHCRTDTNREAHFIIPPQHSFSTVYRFISAVSTVSPPPPPLWTVSSLCSAADLQHHCKKKRKQHFLFQAS